LCVAILLVAIFLQFAATSWLSATKAYVAAFAGGWLFAIAAGITIIELIVRLRLANWEFQKHALVMLISWAILVGLFIAPDQTGRARAEYHLDATATPLPVVDLPGSSPELKWRLVHIIDGRALLISVAKERQNSTFRVIEAKDLPNIATTLPPGGFPKGLRACARGSAGNFL
jgi:hypothetical protein